MKKFTANVRGAAQLNVRTFRSLLIETEALLPALPLVAVVAVCARWGLTRSISPQQAGVAALVGLGAWFLFALLVTWVGGGPLSEPNTTRGLGRVLRPVAYALAPGALTLLGLLPWVGRPLFVVICLWVGLAVTVAVREALTLSRTQGALAVLLMVFLLVAAAGGAFWLVERNGLLPSSCTQESPSG